jgi:hypothetical protein
MRAFCRLGWLRPWPLQGARPQSKTRTSWQAIVKASSAALRATGGTSTSHERFLDEITGRIYRHMAARKVAIWASSGTPAGRGPPNASSPPGQWDGVETMRKAMLLRASRKSESIRRAGGQKKQYFCAISFAPGEAATLVRKSTCCGEERGGLEPIAARVTRPDVSDASLVHVLRPRGSYYSRPALRTKMKWPSGRAIEVKHAL